MLPNPIPSLPPSVVFGRSSRQRNLPSQRSRIGQDPDITQQERDGIVEYLASNFRSLPKINVNKARSKDLEAASEVAPKDAESIVRYRTDHCNFKNLEDLKKVPGLDSVKVAAHADRLEF